MLIQLLLNISIMTATPLHVFPDGYIDRAVAVVIRDQEIQIEYSAAMNDQTISDILTRWQSTPDNAADRMPGKNNQNSNKRPRQSSSIPLPEDGDEEDFKNDAQLMEKIQQAAAKQVPQELEVRVNGQPIKLRLAEDVPPVRHHMSFTLAFRGELLEENASEKQTLQLEVRDRSFFDFDGGVRYALKTTGRAILINSNVAPILVRAERQELAELEEEKRQQLTTIDATLVCLPEKK